MWSRTTLNDNYEDLDMDRNQLQKILINDHNFLFFFFVGDIWIVDNIFPMGHVLQIKT